MRQGMTRATTTVSTTVMMEAASSKSLGGVASIYVRYHAFVLLHPGDSFNLRNGSFVAEDLPGVKHVLYVLGLWRI